MATFTDDFNRADSDTITGGTVAWVEQNFAGSSETGWEIVSNKLVNTETYYIHAIAGDTGDVDHWSECVVDGVDAGSDACGPSVRVNSSGSEGYYLAGWNDRARLYKITGGSITTVTDFDFGTDMNGKTLKLTATGNELEVFVNGVSKGTSNQTDYSANQYVGVAARDACTIDDFDSGPDSVTMNGAAAVTVSASLTASGAAVVAASVFSDDFNRADSDTITGGTVAWVETDFAGAAQTGFEIVSNVLRQTEAFYCLAVAGNSGRADHYSEATVAGTLDAGNVAAGPAVRLSDDGTEGFYLAGWSDRVRLYKIESGSLSQIADWNAGINHDGKTLTLEANGTSLDGYVDGVLVGSSTQTDYSNNRSVGVAGRGNASLENFSGGDYSARGGGSRWATLSAVATVTATGTTDGAGYGSSGYSDLNLLHYPQKDDDSVVAWGQQVNENVGAVWSLLSQAFRGWDPSPTGISVEGNLESEGYYHQIGYSLNAQFAYRIGSTTTTSGGEVVVTLPVPAQDGPAVLGACSLLDASTGKRYGGVLVLESGVTSTAKLVFTDVGAMTNTSPITLTDGDTISGQMFYEASGAEIFDPAAIQFTTPMSSQSVNPGDNATFEWLAVAPSGGAITYDFDYFNDTGDEDSAWINLQSSTATSYTFTSVTLADADTVVRCTADNGVDTPATSSAVLSVAETGTEVVFVDPPANQSKIVGGSVTYSWLAESPTSAPISYTIETEDPNGVGENGSGFWSFGTQFTTSYTFSGLSLADNGLRVRITASDGVANNAVAWATTTVTGDGSSDLTINDVFFIGHSLMNQGLTPGYNFSTNNNPNPSYPNLNTADYIATACTAAGFTCHGVHANSGADVYDLYNDVVLTRTLWNTADTIVLDCIINGDESGAAFLTQARAINSYILAEVPTMHIVWMEGHADPSGTVGSRVANRYANKNPQLQTMVGADEIAGVVPWAQYAAANLSIYQLDGVHHWADQRPYADRMISRLTELAQPIDPTPDTLGIAERHMGFDNQADYHFGNPLALTGPGNVHIKAATELGMPFKAVETGTITDLSLNIKMNNAKGYSGENLGDLRAEIRTANATTGEPTSTVLGQFTLADPTSPSGDSTNGNVGKWSFDSGISVTAGNAYAVVIRNTAAGANTNFFSINLMVEFPTNSSANSPPPDPYFQNIATGNGFFSPWIKNGGFWDPDGGGTWNNYYGSTRSDTTMAWHNSCFEIYYQSGARQGQAYVGALYGDANYERNMTSAVRFRQKMISQRGNRTATHVSYRSGMARQQWPSGVVVGCTLRNSAGTSLATASIVKAGAYWGRGQLSTPVAIADATEYWLDIWVSSGGSFPMRAMQTSLNGHGWVANGSSDLPGPGLLVSTNSGASYSQPGNGASYELSLFLDTVPT